MLHLNDTHSFVWEKFLLTRRCASAVLAMALCLSVCHTPVLCRNCCMDGSNSFSAQRLLST